MIAFITSVKHPWNCRSYERIGWLLDRALASVCRQTDSDFVVVVVCNRKPGTSCTDRRVEFIEVPFPPASADRGHISDFQHFRFDKGAKLAAGLLRVVPYRPHHVMFFDFDDLVHRDVAAFVNARPAADGWYIDRGYVYWEGSARVTPVQGFHRLCGTSNILAFRLVDLSNRLEPSASKEVIVETLGEFFVAMILGGHSQIAGHFIENGYSIEPLPFCGAIWVRGTKENVLAPMGFPSLGGRKVTPQIRDDFGLEVPQTSFLGELAASCRQTLPLWREARRVGGWSAAVRETFWRGPLRTLDTLRGKAWKLEEDSRRR